MLDAAQCILINLYNSNTETEQVKNLEELQNLLKNLNISQNKNIFVGNFNIFLYTKLEARCGKPLLKRKLIGKLLETKKSWEIFDVWRIRNSYIRSFTFRQNHSTVFIEHRIDFIFISNCLQELVNNTEIFSALLTDISSLLILFL